MEKYVYTNYEEAKKKPATTTRYDGQRNAHVKPAVYHHDTWNTWMASWYFIKQKYFRMETSRRQKTKKKNNEEKNDNNIHIKERDGENKASVW